MKSWSNNRMAEPRYGQGDFQVGKYYTINTIIEDNIPRVTHGKIYSIRADRVIMMPSKEITGPYNNNGNPYNIRSAELSSVQVLFSDMRNIKRITSNEFSKLPPETPATMNMDGGKRKKRRSTRRKSRVSKHKKRVHTKRR
jgi:hypothetical protein